jgi:hypothetical protein
MRPVSKARSRAAVTRSEETAMTSTLFPAVEHDADGHKHPFTVQINNQPGYGNAETREAADRIFDMRVAQRPPADMITMKTGSTVIRTQNGTVGAAKGKK